MTDLSQNNTGHMAEGPAVVTEIRAEAVYAGGKALPDDGGGQNLKLLWTRWGPKNGLQLHHQIWWKPEGSEVFNYRFKMLLNTLFWRVRQRVSCVFGCISYEYDSLSCIFSGRNYQIEPLEGVHCVSTNIFSVEQFKYAPTKPLQLFSFISLKGKFKLIKRFVIGENLSN